MFDIRPAWVTAVRDPSLPKVKDRIMRVTPSQRTTPEISLTLEPARPTGMRQSEISAFVHGYFRRGTAVAW